MGHACVDFILTRVTKRVVRQVKLLFQRVQATLHYTEGSIEPLFRQIKVILAI